MDKEFGIIDRAFLFWHYIENAEDIEKLIDWIRFNGADEFDAKMKLVLSVIMEEREKLITVNEKGGFSGYALVKDAPHGEDFIDKNAKLQF